MIIKVSSVEWTWLGLSDLLPSMLACTNDDVVSPISLCTLLYYCSLQFNLLQLQFDDAKLKDLKKVVPKIGYAIMWSYELWTELDAQIVKNCWRMVCILHAAWNIDFALVDERDKNRMQKETHEVGAMISKL